MRNVGRGLCLTELPPRDLQHRHRTVLLTYLSTSLQKTSYSTPVQYRLANSSLASSPPSTPQKTSLVRPKPPSLLRSRPLQLHCRRFVSASALSPRGTVHQSTLRQSPENTARDCLPFLSLVPFFFLVFLRRRMDGSGVARGAASHSPASPTSSRQGNGIPKRKRSIGVPAHLESSPGSDHDDEHGDDKKRQPGVKRACNECRQQKVSRIRTKSLFVENKRHHSPPQPSDLGLAAIASQFGGL